MQAMGLWIFLFIVSAAVITYAGWRLTRAVDAIADRTGIGRAFLGMILVATVTSLPELSTGVSAITVANAPDIAVGDIFGSCVFNLLLFVLADATARRKAFYGALSSSHALSASASLILLGVAVLAITTPAVAGLSLGHVGAGSIALAVLYLGAARLLYAVDVRAAPAADEADAHPGVSLRAAIVQCVLAGAAVTLAGTLIAVSADRISEGAGISQSSMGVLVVGAATSLPEVVAVLAAIRLNAYDLAAGNLLGSNLFNMLVLVVDDVVYLDGPLLQGVSPALAGTAVVAMMMTGVFMAALHFVRRAEPSKVDWGIGAALAALFLLNVWIAGSAAH